MTHEHGRALIERARDRFARAAEAAGCHEHDRCVAGVAVRLRYAGPALEAGFAPALGHHPPVPAGTEPAATVSLWDGASTGVTVGVQPPSGQAPAGPGVRHELHDGAADVLWVHDTVTITDDRARDAWWYLPDARSLPWFEVAGPLRYWFAAWAHRHGRVFTHAAAVGDDRGAVLLVGMGGSGKSTAALACIGGGLRYLGDDYVVVEPGPVPRVHNVYGTAKLVPGGAWRVPLVHASFVDGDATADRKLVACVAEQFPDAVVSSLPLRVVLACRITGGTTRVVPIGARDALLGVAPSTLLQLPRQLGSGALARLRDVVTGLPAFRLELGDDTAAVPDAIAAVLAELDGARHG